MNKKRKISNTKTNFNHKRFQKVTPITIIKKSDSRSGDNLVYKSLIGNGFNVLEESIPKYNQSITGLQLEYIQFYENFFKFMVSFQKSIIEKLGIKPIQFEKTEENNSKVFEYLFKINSLKFESFILSLESFTDIIREWNTLFLSYSNTCQKIFSYKKN